MKRIVCMLLLGSVLLLSGCGQPEEYADSKEREESVSTASLESSSEDTEETTVTQAQTEDTTEAYPNVPDDGHTKRY